MTNNSFEYFSVDLEYQYNININKLKGSEQPTCTLGYAKVTDLLARGIGRGISINNFLWNRIGWIIDHCTSVHLLRKTCFLVYFANDTFDEINCGYFRLLRIYNHITINR